MCSYSSIGPPSIQGICFLKFLCITGLFLSAFPSSVNSRPPTAIADVSPLGKYVHVGDDVTINCTLRDASSVNVDWLYFTRVRNGISEKVPQEAQRVVQPDTVQLVLRQVTRQDAGQYFCFLREGEGASGGSPATFMHSQIDVGESTKPVENFGCTLSESSMDCSWCDSVSTGPHYDYYTLTWTLQSRPDVSSRCESYASDWCGCHVTGEQLVRDDVYRFTLTGRNDFGSSTTSHSYSTSDTTDTEVKWRGDDGKMTVQAPPEIPQVHVFNQL